MPTGPHRPVPPAAPPPDDTAPPPHWHIEAIREGLREAAAERFADDAEVAAFFAKWCRTR